MSEQTSVLNNGDLLQPNKLVDLKKRFIQERDRYIRTLLNDPNFVIPTESQPQNMLSDLLTSVDIKSLIPREDDLIDSGVDKMKVARVILSVLPKIQKAFNVGSIRIHISSLPKVSCLKDLSDLIGMPVMDLWIIGSTRGQYVNLADYLKANVFTIIPTLFSNFVNL